MLKYAGQRSHSRWPLQGLILRAQVIQDLIEILRHSGYPGYESHGINSSARVAQRLEDRYGKYRDLYGHAAFTPSKIEEAINVQQKSKTSIVQEKCATPAEAVKEVKVWDESQRPHHIMAERSARSRMKTTNLYLANSELCALKRVLSW